MKTTVRSSLFFVAYVGIFVSAMAMVGMSPGARADSAVIKKFSPKEIAALDTLKSELNRRFTDRQNVDFGMSRVIRTGQRYHAGPTMGKIERLTKEQTRSSSDGKYEVLVDGEWVSMTEKKPLMSPENETEIGAIQFLKDSRLDVAIYTVGQFELDKGEVPGPDAKQVSEKSSHNNGFSYGGYNSLRAKGPAYTSQKSSLAPRAYELVEFGRKAWASKEQDCSADGKDGWTYIAHRVSAPEMSCANCHGDRKVGSIDVSGAVKKAGDPVGLFVMAVRRK